MKRLYFGIIALSLTVSCNVFSRSRVTVFNDSRFPAENLVVAIANDTKSLGELQPGRQAMFASRPQGDGAISVTYRFQGAPVNLRFGYVTKHAPTNCRVTIRQSGPPDVGCS
jgi:hypothetical protein